MIPGSGGEAQYLSQGFGPLMVFLFNWTSIVILKPGTVSILALATAKYLYEMLDQLIPALKFKSTTTLAVVEKLLAAIICLIVTLAAALSTKWSNRVQNGLAFGKLGALALIICSGLYYAIKDPRAIKANLGRPFEGSSSSFESVSGALINGLWAYEGWNNLNIVAGNLANPRVNLPLSIWISMVAVVSLYLFTWLGYYAVLDKALIAKTETVGAEFGVKVFGLAGNIIMPILIASSTFGSALSSMITSAEIVVLAASTGQLPKYFKKVSPTFGTAARAYWLQGVISAALVTLADFDQLMLIYTIPTWIFYAACVVVLLKLRVTAPKMERPYKVWLSTPILFLVSCVFVIGVPLYYLVGIHTRLSKVANAQ